MRKGLLALLIATIAVASWTVTVLSVDDAPATSNAGLIIHIDPATGSVVGPERGALPVVLEPKFRSALNSSWEGLEQVPSPVIGGGVIVHLQGRYQHGYVAVIGDNGDLKVTCISNVPPEETPEHTSQDEDRRGNR